MRCILSLLVPMAAMGTLVVAPARAQIYNLGKMPDREEIRKWDIAIGPAGKELPPGSGSAKEGAQIFAQKCAACHGRTGVEGPAKVLAGGLGTLTNPRPVRTIGSYWPFATTVWDYINRATPRNKEGSLTPDEVYALTAYLLHRNGIIRETDVMDAKTLPKVKMPNREGFIPPRLEDIR